ncbi:TPR repeat [Cryptosporidium sp. chipmunk genotype I]|uniref:TPR repeat n=1 Tax=Cryptosporidium sp. chipmunk genotype I TaxID=1280935 RepID=UPI00351A3CB4|nr:TPR repeat [Cryptosporidium sp. chipmunk genotype I]
MIDEQVDGINHDINFSKTSDSQPNENMAPSAKEKGNEEYNNKEYEKAIEHWLRAYRSCCYILSKNVYSEMPEKEKEIRVLKMQLDSNLSIAYLKLQDYPNTIHYANKALEYEPNNLKALHHKSRALFELSEYKQCVECADIALKVEPDNIVFKKVRHNALLKQKQYISKSKKISEALFKNSKANEKSVGKPKQYLIKTLMDYFDLFFNSKVGKNFTNTISKLCPTRVVNNVIK